MADMPYRHAARRYTAAGWVGVLPLPHGSKQLKIRGWTGHHGAWPSVADVQAWIDSDDTDEGGGNIALRLPRDVLGVDVDAYDPKPGGSTLVAAINQWGPLPDTWISTARTDGVSGIRLFRVPEGLGWPAQLGPGVDLIQHAHRYLLVWPSHHPDGGTYRWYSPSGAEASTVPTIEELPPLPPAWVDGLTGGRTADHDVKADLDLRTAQTWLLGAPPGPRCRRMDTTLGRATADLTSAGSRHDTTRDAVLRLVRLAQQHHPGLADALSELHTAFLLAATDPRRGQARSREQANAEWGRILRGAVSIVVANPGAATDPGPDPCQVPFADLITQPVASPVSEEPLATAPDPPQAPPLADTGPDTGPDTDHDDDDTERSSWWPVNLTPVLAGHATEPEPVVLRRDDGQALLYAGKINGLLGESESGKSWIAQLAVTQELRAGHNVLYLDYEDTAAGIVSRLRALGLDDTTIATGLTYLSPEEPLTAAASADFYATLTERRRSLIVLDGVNAAMTLLGMELESNTDATRFAQLLLRPLAATGAAVLTIDHVPKDPDKRGKGGIGAQAKRAMITGAALTVTVISAFGRGSTGKLRLAVDKDRPGWVRGAAVDSKNAGIVVLQSDGDSVMVTVAVDPERTPALGQQLSGFRPTTLMTRVSNYLSTVDGGVSTNQIEKAVEGKRDGIRRALDVLVTEGYVTRSTGPRGAVLHHHATRYSELVELVARNSDQKQGDPDD